jgi:hypothetical protein
VASTIVDCHHCREAMKHSAELKERVLEAVRRTPSPPRSEARREARRVLLATIVIVTALFFAVDGVDHSLGRPAWFLASSLGLWGVVALLALRGAWRGGVAFGAGSLTSLATVIVGAPAVLLVASLLLSRWDPALVQIHPERLGLHCFAMTLAAAAYPLVGLSRARRWSDPMHPIASGSALGVACGACAGVMVDLWCPVAAPRHVLIGHILPMGVLALFGAGLGARIIAMRHRHLSA